MKTFKHWKLTIREDKIVELGFDREGQEVNTINDEVLSELDEAITEIESRTEIKGVLLYSMKDKGFIAGADVNYFSKFETSEELAVFLKKGHQVFDHLESLKVPTVAMIDGFCMGGGFELVLACDYRVASDEKETRLGLPEILLGIFPGWGGTVRLPPLIGGLNALTKFILTGRAFSAKAAKRFGVVDEAVPVRQLKRAALSLIERKPAKRSAKWFEKLSDASFIKPILAKLVRNQVAKKALKEHYPAPFAAIDNWLAQRGFTKRDKEREIRTIESLVEQGETSKNLIRAFLLRERMKRFAKESSFKATHLHVVGAGIMGGDIAAWGALKGLKVTLQDRNLEAIAPAMSRAHKLFKKKLKKSRLVEAALDRLIPDPNGHGLKQADVIIEAIYENLEAKQTLFKRIEAEARKEAILASNTSSIPLDEISEVLGQPERLLGIHFFNPVARMELVEVVFSQTTDPKLLEHAHAFVGQIGKLPLPVKSSPGFLVNRVLMPYLLECVTLLDEGVQPQDIDYAAKKFGMMMGPVELADTVGLDVCLAVAENLTKAFGGSIPDKLRTLVADKQLGKKTGRGFYQYKKGKAQKEKVVDKNWQPHANRLILRMISEASQCLSENVVADPDLLDGAMIFGTGFAPFRGGPMKYSEDFGKDKLNSLFAELTKKHGSRFSLDNE
jgi:3-hydroxyacyl-CoA dehydrogenase/enoyl-CoA hydratase/3-hydroxybutyryl-CoA epimerase